MFFFSLSAQNIVISVIQFMKVLRCIQVVSKRVGILMFITKICTQIVENVMNTSDFHPTHR